MIFQGKAILVTSGTKARVELLRRHGLVPS
jgi:hypothetical protein